MTARARAVVVGCGRAGSGWDEWDESGAPPRTHAGCYQRSDLTELVGLCDANPIRAADAGERRGVEPWSDLDECLQEARPDVVSVCTPPEQHLSVVRTCVEYGVSVVLCEKPLAHTVEDAREIARLAEESDTVIATMHHRRWMRGLEFARKLFADVNDATVHVTYSGEALNNATHGIDLARAVLGERWRRLVLRESDYFAVSIGNARYSAIFANGGRSLGLNDHREPGLADHASVETEYEHARLRAIEQMARIAQGSDEAPNCTAYDGLRAVELAYEAMSGQEVAA